MLDDFNSDNFVDDHGNPAGGFVAGIGMNITWQNGPLGTGLSRKPPNGAFVETVIKAAAQRLEFYQGSKFNCTENDIALQCLNAALDTLNNRTKSREDRGVEGTHTI